MLARNNLLKNLENLPTNKALGSHKQLSSAKDLKAIYKHLDKLHADVAPDDLNTDNDYTRNIFEARKNLSLFIIESENFNHDISLLLPYISLQEFFEIVIRPDNLVPLVEDNLVFITLTFTSEAHKKIMLELLLKPYNFKYLVKSDSQLYEWISYFSFDESVVHKFYDLLLIHENFNRIVTHHSGLYSSLIKYARTTNQDDTLRHNIIHSNYFTDLVKNNISVMSTIFISADHKKELFEQFIKPKNFPSIVSYIKLNNADIMSERQFQDPSQKETCDLFSWIEFFGKNSDMHNQMLALIFTPKPDKIGISLRGSFQDILECASTEDQKRMIINNYMQSFINYLNDPENVADLSVFDSIAPHLNQHQWDQCADIVLQPQFTCRLPCYSPAFRKYLEIFYPNFSKTQQEKLLDLLLEPDFFRQFISSSRKNRKILFKDDIYKLASLCKENNKEKKLLALIIQYFSHVITDITMLNELGKYFPGAPHIFMQPTLKLAKENARSYERAYKDGVEIGMFSLFSNNIASAMDASGFLGMSDIRNMALTCKQVSDTANSNCEELLDLMTMKKT